MTLLLVVAGAAIGAPLRYLTDRAVQSRHGSRLPWGTFTVNVLGSLVLGALAGGATVGAVSGSIIALLGTGLCGALTTYSTFGYETLRLVEKGAARCAALNAAISVISGLGAASLGWVLATTICP